MRFGALVMGGIMILNFSHVGLIDVLRDPCITEFFIYRRLLANQNNELVFLTESVEEAEMAINMYPALKYAGIDTWNQFFGVLASYEYLDKCHPAFMVDVNLKWGLDFLIASSMDHEDRNELIDELADLLYSAFCQINNLKRKELWNEFFSATHELNETTFLLKEDIRIKEYMRMLKEHKEHGATEFVPALKFVEVNQYFSGLRKRCIRNRSRNR